LTKTKPSPLDQSQKNQGLNVLAAIRKTNLLFGVLEMKLKLRKVMFVKDVGINSNPTVLFVHIVTKAI
jgi:hypothetical protein